MRAAGAIPLEPYKSSQTKWKCRCKKCKEIIYPSLAPIKNRGIGPCQKCAALEMGARRRAKAEAANIEILKKANFVPLEEFPGGHKPWRVRCTKCKKESSPHLSSIKNGSACGYCAGTRIDELDVRKIYKKAGYEPIGKYPGSSRKKWKSIHKPCGQTVSPEFAKVKLGIGCSYCAGNTKISESAARRLFIKNKLEPLEPFVNSQKPWKSKCLITGKVVSPTYGKVRDNGHRCKYCSENVTDEVDAVAIMQKAGFKPIATFPGGNKPWKSQCLKCKKVFSPNFTSIKMGFGCRYCNHAAVDPKDAIAAMKRRGFKTLEPYPGASKPWMVQCLGCKKKFNSVLGSLNNNARCKYCQSIAVDVEDLLLRLKELKLKPLERYQSATTPWKCKCLVCNHVVQPTWSRIKSGRGHCAYCSQRRVDIPAALKFMKTISLKPLVEFPGTNKPWKSMCLVCKSEVAPRWSDLRRGQGGCSNCADYGLNYQKPGYIYLISHPEMQAHKIGIANSYKSRKFDDRMYKHQKQGWEIYKTKTFTTVKEASDIETEILKWLRIDVGLSFPLTAKLMPQGGHTETVDASEIDLPTIWAKVLELSKVKK
ncbi:hypothetical protein MCEMRE26_00141 [Candidatus Nanopelagicaceae bacterium]